MAIAEAMPWNLSISVDSILLKNLVLIRLSVFGASPFKEYKKEVIRRSLFLSIPEVLQYLYYKRKSSRITYRERFPLSRVVHLEICRFRVY